MPDPATPGERCGCVALAPLCTCQQTCWNSSTGSSLSDYLTRLNCLNLCADKGPFIRECWTENGPTASRWGTVEECRNTCGDLYFTALEAGDSGARGALATCLGNCEPYDDSEFKCDPLLNPDLNEDIADCMEPKSDQVVECYAEADDVRTDCEGPEPDYDDPDPVTRSAAIAEYAVKVADCCDEYFTARGECDKEYYYAIPACTGDQCNQRCQGDQSQQEGVCQTCVTSFETGCDLTCYAGLTACLKPCGEANESCSEACYEAFPFHGPAWVACLAVCGDTYATCSDACESTYDECQGVCADETAEKQETLVDCNRDVTRTRFTCNSDCCGSMYASEKSLCYVARIDDEDACQDAADDADPDDPSAPATYQLCMFQAQYDERICLIRRWNEVIEVQKAWNHDVYDCAIDCDSLRYTAQELCLPANVTICPSGDSGESCRQCQRDATADMMDCKVQCCMDKEPPNPLNLHVPCMKACYTTYWKAAPGAPREAALTSCTNACRANNYYGACSVCNYFIGTPGHLPTDPDMENDNLVANLPFYFRRCIPPRLET